MYFYRIYRKRLEFPLPSGEGAGCISPVLGEGHPGAALRDADLASGRSPGSRAGVLPGTAPSRALKRSGIVLFLNSLTVAGAAPALFPMNQERTGFPFNPGRRTRRDT
jgi:hypothetical protein